MHSLTVNGETFTIEVSEWTRGENSLCCHIKQRAGWPLDTDALLKRLVDGVYVFHGNGIEITFNKMQVMVRQTSQVNNQIRFLGYYR